MKNWLHIVTAVTLLSLVSSVTSADDASVLLQDGFETGAAAPKGWKQGAAIPGVKYHYDKRVAKSGKRSLSLQKSANRYFPIAQWGRVLPLKGDYQAIQVTVQVRASKATKAIVDVIFLDEQENMNSHQWACYIGSKQADDPPADHDWKEYSGVVDIPSGTKKIMLALQIYGPGKVWFDNLEAKFVQPASDNAAQSRRPSTKNIAHKPIEIKVGQANGRYLYQAARTQPASGTGSGLLIVLPGGDGSADFFPFVKRIHANALSDEFALAQPLAKMWADDQVVVWPTSWRVTDTIQYTTEELVAAVVDHVAERTRIDRRRVYLLAWSSGGPAAYATLMQPESPVVGGLIAMSVFKPDQLPDVANAKQRSFYLLHSPQDRVCPYWMAQTSSETLSKAGVRNILVDYEGGHGWRGDVFGNIRRGIEWLDKPL